ncbi:MAG TPA: cupin domain-containing protein, partial [Pyrinomonadaceae bacterium]|nr:cupin domain-containing protein [Pyrinomonadaceae bacterium]
MKGAAFDSLAKLLEPCPEGEFLDSSWGKAFRHVRGGAGKFSGLMPWESLNEILGRNRLDFPRLRIVRDGKTVPAADYIRHVKPRRGATIPRLVPAEIISQLRGGATLVLDAVNELHEPVEELAAALEFKFHESVQVNLYAGWQTSRGFDLHWDDHDVFILQVTGRKRWSLYGETRPNPVSGDAEEAERPAGPPVWDETLEDGDLLYIPRGCWHVAFPLAEPTLHLTVGVHKRRGLDLLRWLSERMKASEAFRADLPRFASQEERRAHSARLREEFLAEWDAEALERFFAEADAKAEPRARLSLPWSATTEALPRDGGAVVRWAPPRPVEFKVEGGVVEFECVGRRWRFSEDALAVLKPLSERRVCTVAELCEGAQKRLAERTVRALLRDLLLNGLVAV